MKRYTVMILLALLGCATSKTTYAPDGRAAHAINCSGNARSWDGCYSKAGDLCGASGYDILSRDGDIGAAVAATGGFLGGGAFSTRSLLIACK